MATFTCNDIDGFVLSMEEMAKLPDRVIKDIVSSGAEVIKEAHEKAIRSTFTARTGRLMGSPKVFMKRKGKSWYALIYPEGTHHTYHAKKSGGVATNAEVGFVHEFGGHGNAATAWMLNSNEQSADATAQAEESVYNEWLDSLNL
ncbi:MAG: hypothetical protein IJQ02_04240 [Oscillospiraceae bacterium]|nr:hypothetical protein [Oscillospiraceae bacterium]